MKTKADKNLDVMGANAGRPINQQQAFELLDASTFALSVIKSQGLWDMSEKMAAEKLTKAIQDATS